MSSAQSYIPVPVDTLVGETRTEFDLYVQLNQKHVLYLRKGGEFDSNRIQKLRDKNVKHMWVAKAEAVIYRDFCERRLSAPFNLSTDMAPAERSAAIAKSLCDSVEALLKAPNSDDLYVLARDGARRLTDFVLKSDDALKIVLMPSTRERTVTEHGVAVAAIAIAIAKRVGHADAKDLHLLALGGLMHDAGYHGQANSVFGRKATKLSADEQRAFNDHALNGARPFQGLQHVDQAVLKVIVEHEENIDGSGFPKGLNESKMHPYAVIAATANAFEHYINQDGENYSGALKRIFVERMGKHPLAQMNALKSIAQSLST